MKQAVLALTLFVAASQSAMPSLLPFDPLPLDPLVPVEASALLPEVKPPQATLYPLAINKEATSTSLRVIRMAAASANAKPRASCEREQRILAFRDVPDVREQ